VSVDRLFGSGRLALHDSALLAPSLTVPPARDSAVIGTGDDAVPLLGAGVGGLVAYDLAGDGRIDAPRAPVDIDPAPAPVDRLAFPPYAGGGDRLALSGSGIYDMDPVGGVTPLAGPSGPGIATGLMEGAAGPVLIRAMAGGGESLGAGGVRLAPLDVLDSATRSTWCGARTGWPPRLCPNGCFWIRARTFRRTCPVRRHCPKGAISACRRSAAGSSR
jgi:hypothetical protein